MKYSIYDERNAHFFGVSLCNKKFVYDGSCYNSVNDCFNNRKFNKMLWNPSSVPMQHLLHLTNSIGFVYSTDESMAYVIDCDSIDEVSITKACRYFENIVKSMLFAEYYEQVFVKTGMLSTDLASRYHTAYKACISISNNVNLCCKWIEFNKYKPAIAAERCLLISNSVLHSGLVIPECSELIVPSDVFKKASKHGYGWLSCLYGNESLKIVCDTIKRDDFYWTLVQNSGIDFNLIDFEDISYPVYTIIFGSSGDDRYNRLIDWNNAFIYGMG